MMYKSVIVDIGSMAVSASPEEMLVTYALGSCIGVTFYDTVLRIGGMAHLMLPLSPVDPQRAEERPFMFVDIGVPRLLEDLFARGCRKRDLLVRMAGGAQVMSDNNLFRIGERNVAVFRKIMWKNGLLIQGQETGGSVSRTLRLEIATGRLTIRSQGVETEL
ncbi:MAG: chemotaxis protein CheD [bacterium]